MRYCSGFSSAVFPYMNTFLLLGVVARLRLPFAVAVKVAVEEKRELLGELARHLLDVEDRRVQ